MTTEGTRSHFLFIILRSCWHFFSPLLSIASNTLTFSLPYNTIVILAINVSAREKLENRLIKSLKAFTWKQCEAFWSNISLPSDNSCDIEKRYWKNCQLLMLVNIYFTFRLRQPYQLDPKVILNLFYNVSLLPACLQSQSSPCQRF